DTYAASGALARGVTRLRSIGAECPAFAADSSAADRAGRGQAEIACIHAAYGFRGGEPDRSTIAQRAHTTSRMHAVCGLQLAARILDMYAVECKVLQNLVSRALCRPAGEDGEPCAERLGIDKF